MSRSYIVGGPAGAGFIFDDGSRNYALTPAYVMETASGGATNVTVNVTGQSVTASVGTVSVETNLWTPEEITSGMVGWFDAADASTITLSGSNLTVWDDKSPANNNATPPATGPTVSAAAINGLNALSFVNQGLHTSPVAFSGDYTVFALFKSPTAGFDPYERVIDHGFTVSFWIGRNNTTAAWGGGFAESTDPYGRFLSLTNGTVNIISTRRSGSTHTIALNGDASSTSGTVTTAAAPSSDIVIGNDVTTTGPMKNGLIGEVLVWNVALTTDDRAKTEGYLAWKWGIQASLPVGHAYKDAPPTTGAVSVTVPVTSPSMAATDGTVTVSTGASVSVTSDPLVASVGSVSVAAGGGISVSVVGQDIVASVGDVTVGIVTDVVVEVTQSGMTAAVGTVDAAGRTIINVTSTGMTALTETPTVTGKANVIPTGQAASAFVGNLIVTGKSNIVLTSPGLTATAGNLTILGQRVGAGIWSPSQTYNATLTNSNKTATESDGEFGESYSQKAHDSVFGGLYYFETHPYIPTVDSYASINVNILDYTNFILVNNEGDVYRTGDVLTDNIGAFHTGDTVCVAVNLTTSKVWFRINSGSWWPTSSDPATGTGGYSLSGTAGEFHIGTQLTTASTTLNTGPSFSYGAPSGFTSWDAGGPMTPGYVRIWNGLSWVDKPVKVWTGSAWVQKPVKVWNGSAWVW